MAKSIVGLRRCFGTKMLKPSGTEKSDLRRLWETAESPNSSPECHKSFTDRHPDILTLLIKNDDDEQPRKKLHCPPNYEISSKTQKGKTPDLEFAYSSFSVTSEEKISRDVLNTVTFAFIGDGLDYGRQEKSWESFKKICLTAKCALVRVVNVLFFFENGVVKGHGVTRVGQEKLKNLSDDLPNVAAEVAIPFVDEWIKKEKVGLYSTEVFNYSTVYPLEIEESDVQTCRGRVYRMKVQGYIFEPVVRELKEKYPQVNFCTNVLRA